MDSDSLSIASGTVFVVSNRNGDILPPVSPGAALGFFAYDTRFLSRYILTVNGKETVLTSSAALSQSAASFYSSTLGTRNYPAGNVSIVRDRYIADGLYENISIVNHSIERKNLHIELSFDADFEDVFEVRLGRISRIRSVSAKRRDKDTLSMIYRRGQLHREVWIHFSNSPEIEGKIASFDIDLDPKSDWRTCISILPVINSSPPKMTCFEDIIGSPFYSHARKEQVSHRTAEKISPGPLREIPQIETTDLAIRESYEQSITDLQALLMKQEDGCYILAAGIPWFAAIFGRDSIISAIQTKLLGPDLMIGTLHTLADLQATSLDNFRDAEPGKLPHEVREVELSIFEQVPHTQYYGSVDVTPLFIILLGEAYRWTGDKNVIKQFLPAAESALQWIDNYGDLDSDGFVEYLRRSKKGLINQGWKDSSDSISFANGILAEPPIALVEVQGYVYDAKLRMAEFYQLSGDDTKARRLKREAKELKDHFNEAFWMPDKGYYALALDKNKRQVDSITSNPGHCLWSGIVDEEKARQVASRLMSPDMFSGWGIRTLSTDMTLYNPLSYHNGSIWPHDNSIIAAGLHRYGFDKEAESIANALFEATIYLPHHRLPELFAGYVRRERAFPVQLPNANSPQAWASGAIIFLLETLLKVIPADNHLLPDRSQKKAKVIMRGVPYRGKMSWSPKTGQVAKVENCS